ncbi:MAG: putative Ig domain-containing protein, partial [Calditrichia bacterium]
MRYFTDILKVIMISGVITLPGFLGAQRSSAELITSILPPVIDSNVQVNDGARQLVLFDNYLLITNFWAGLQLYDITDIENPSRVAFAPTDDDANYTFVDENYAYLANHSAGVGIYEIPQLSEVAHVRTPGNAYSVVAEYPFLYVALGKDGFSIIDIRDMFNPAFLSLEIPGTWVQYLVKRDNLLFVAAKKGGMMIYDISDPESPRMLSQYKTGYDVMMIQLEGDRAFLADGAGGVVVMNIAHPEFPEFILRFNDGGYVQSIFKYGNYVYLANQSKGLQIVNISDLKKPFLEGSYQTDSQAYSVLKRNIYVFLAANKSTLILRHNNDPVLEDIADLNINEGEMFQLQLKAWEPDGDPYVFHAYNLPEGSKFDTTTGLFSWTPSYEQSGIYPDVVFKVSEKTISRLSVADTVTITVRHVNRPPDLPAMKDTSVAENKLLTIVVPEGSDPDIEDQGRLTYSAERLPEGAEFDPKTRTFSWKPTFEQSGTYIIDFLISDSAGGFDREPVTITVYHVDRKPALEMIPGQEVHENEGLALKISGEDPDREDQDKISFKILNLPQGAQFDADNQIFSWTPTFDQSGEYSGIRVVMVAGDLSDTTAFDIKVIHVNRPPQLTAIED